MLNEKKPTDARDVAVFLIQIEDYAAKCKSLAIERTAAIEVLKEIRAQAPDDAIVAAAKAALDEATRDFATAEVALAAALAKAKATEAKREAAAAAAAAAARRTEEMTRASIEAANIAAAAADSQRATDESMDDESDAVLAANLMIPITGPSAEAHSPKTQLTAVVAAFQLAAANTVLIETQVPRTTHMCYFCNKPRPEQNNRSRPCELQQHAANMKRVMALIAFKQTMDAQQVVDMTTPLMEHPVSVETVVDGQKAVDGACKQCGKETAKKDMMCNGNHQRACPLFRVFARVSLLSPTLNLPPPPQADDAPATVVVAKSPKQSQPKKKRRLATLTSYLVPAVGLSSRAQTLAFKAHFTVGDNDGEINMLMNELNHHINYGKTVDLTDLLRIVRRVRQLPIIEGAPPLLVHEWWLARLQKQSFNVRDALKKIYNDDLDDEEWESDDEFNIVDEAATDEANDADDEDDEDDEDDDEDDEDDDEDEEDYEEEALRRSYARSPSPQAPLHPGNGVEVNAVGLPIAPDMSIDMLVAIAIKDTMRLSAENTVLKSRLERIEQRYFAMEREMQTFKRQREAPRTVESMASPLCIEALFSDIDE